MNNSYRQWRGRGRFSRAAQGRPAPTAPLDPVRAEDKRLVGELYGQSGVAKAWNSFFVMMGYLQLEALRQTARVAEERGTPSSTKHAPEVTQVTPSSVTIEVAFAASTQGVPRSVAASVEVDADRGVSIRWTARNGSRATPEPSRSPARSIALPRPREAHEVAREIVRTVVRELELRAEGESLVSPQHGVAKDGKAWEWFFATMNHVHLEALRQSARAAHERAELHRHVNQISPPSPSAREWRGVRVTQVTPSSITMDVTRNEPTERGFQLVAVTIDVDVERGLGVRWSARDGWRGDVEPPKKYPGGNKPAQYKAHAIGLPGPGYAPEVARDFVRAVIRDLDLHDGFGVEYSTRQRDVMVNRGLRLVLEQREARKAFNMRRR